MGETFAFHVSEHSPLWTSRNPISPIGLRSSITVYTSQPKSWKIKTIENGFVKSHFQISAHGMLQCHKSVDRFPNIGRPIYLILSGIPTATYRSTDLPKSVDRFVLWTNQFKTKRKPKRRVQTIIKIILTKPGLPQQPLGLSSRARTCGTCFRRTDPEESSKDLKSQNTVFKELSSSKPQNKFQNP